MKRIDPDAAGERAEQLFRSGCNCTQAVVCAFEEAFDMPREQLMKTVSALGGGMSRMREVCGAVSGALLVTGAYAGYDTPGDDAGKMKVYALGQEIGKAFQEAFGTMICRELLHLSENGFSVPAPEKRTADYYTARPCARCIHEAARITAEVLNRYFEEAR